MSKNDRNPLNPFTGKKEYDTINDDAFLQQCYKEYAEVLRKSPVLDNTPQGQLVNHIVAKLINSVRDYLSHIGRLDYVDGYYDWEVHLVQNNVANAFCMPGGKIVVFSGILNLTKTEDDLAFILGHEISHALLDHSRTQASKQQTKSTIVNAGVGLGYLLNMAGLGEVGTLIQGASQIANVGSELLYLQPHSRNHEMEADKLGLIITYLAGYNIQSIPEFWERMSSQSSNEFDLFSTHPADSKRIKQMNEMIAKVLSQKNIYDDKILLDDNDDTQPQTQQQQGEATQIIENKKVCPQCKRYGADNTNFCVDCGVPLELEATCSNCGAKMLQSTQFCVNCGSKFVK